MKKIVIVFVLFWCNGLFFAQSVYKIELGTRDNSVTLSINNPNDTKIENIIVSTTNYPEWVKFNNKKLVIATIESKTRYNAVFTFDITNDAPLNTESELLFRIDSPSGSNWVKKINIVAIVPIRFELLQNYPNPFNPTTKIKYSIPQKGFVSLDIFNILGEKVASLVNGVQDVGRYEISFDASNLPAGRQGLASGIYVYSLRSGSFNSVKKMLLMK